MPITLKDLEATLDKQVSEDENWKTLRAKASNSVRRFEVDVFPVWLRDTLATIATFPAASDEIIRDLQAHITLLGKTYSAHLLSLDSTNWDMQSKAAGRMLAKNVDRYRNAGGASAAAAAGAGAGAAAAAAAQPAPQPKPVAYHPIQKQKKPSLDANPFHDSKADVKGDAKFAQVKMDLGAAPAAMYPAAGPPVGRIVNEVIPFLHPADRPPACAHGVFNLDGKFLSYVMRPLVLVRTATGKGIYVVLDTGDSKGLRLHADMMMHLGLVESASSAVMVLPVDAIPPANPLIERSIVECSQAKSVANVLVSVGKEHDRSDQIVLTMGFLRDERLAARLLPDAQPRYNLLKKPSRDLAITLGIQQYCTPIQIVKRDSLDTNNQMFYVPIESWEGNRPNLATKTKGQGGEDLTSVCWDTGSPLNLVGRTTALRYGLNLKQARKLNTNTKIHGNLSLAAFDWIELNCLKKPPLKFTNVPVVVLDDDDYPLVLGWTLFGLFGEILLGAHDGKNDCIGFLPR